MPDSILNTERLLLRPIVQEDLGALLELDGDPLVMRYLSGGASTPREVMEETILPRLLGGGYYAAVERRSERFAGWFSLVPTGRNGEAELGYRLRRAVWGRGYATEGARELIRFGFEEMGFDRIVANTYEHNLASRRVMEKVGMRHVRSYRPTLEDLSQSATFNVASNELWDGEDVVYAIAKEEWRSRCG